VAEVAHLGVPWADRLARAGVHDRAALAAADPEELLRKLEAQREPVPHPGLVRIWIRAARDSR
jgi:hypothetical protein